MTATVTSSATTATVTTPTPTNWVLLDPQNPSNALSLHRLGTLSITMTVLQAPISFTATEPQDQGVFQAFGRPNNIVQLGDLHSGTIDLLFLLIGYQEKATYEALRNASRPMFVRSDYGAGWYVTFPATLTPALLHAGDRVTDPMWEVGGNFTVVDRP